MFSGLDCNTNNIIINILFEIFFLLKGNFHKLASLYAWPMGEKASRTFFCFKISWG